MQTWVDFGIPMKPSAAGDAAISDWYGIHVRLGETLGKRVDDNTPRFLYANEPSIHGFGRALRLRTCNEDVSKTLRGIGAPIVARGDETSIIEGRSYDLSMTISARYARKSDAIHVIRTPSEHVFMMLEKNGFALEGQADIEEALFRIRKGWKGSFVIPGLSVNARVRVINSQAALNAMIHGIGRDRGMGFGMIVLDSCEVTH